MCIGVEHMEIMDSKMEQVNMKILDSGTFSARLVEERVRLGMSQTDLRIKTGAAKATQSRYETGESFPGADYLAVLDAAGFDVMYLLTGVRSAEGLDDELRNLVDAYIHSGDAIKTAVFSVLVAPYTDDALRARRIPGWLAHELRGDEDVRYRQPAVVPVLLQDGDPAFPGSKRADPEGEASAGEG